MSDKVLKKQRGRCLRWLQRLGELYTEVTAGGDAALVVSQRSADNAAQPGYVVLNGGVLAGCTPRGVLSVLQACGLLASSSRHAEPQAQQRPRLLFYGPTLPFVLVRQSLPSPPALVAAQDSATLTDMSTVFLEPGRCWYIGDCLAVRVPQTDALWREGSSRNRGCGLLFLVPCDYDALYAAFAARFQRHALCLPATTPQDPSSPMVQPSNAPRSLECRLVEAVPGLCCVPDFITVDEERAIWEEIQEHRDQLTLEYLSRRRVAHFNRRFMYGINKLGSVGQEVNDEPSFFGWMRARLNNTDPNVAIRGPYPVDPPGSLECDQLTVNYYDYVDGHTPGIATHVDAHSAFDDCIFLVSLGSYTVMDFCPWQAADEEVIPPVPVFIAPRSLVIMSGESRYGWTHCIAEKRTDIVDEFTDVLVRQDRVSLTWRRGREGAHAKATCPYPAMCDGE